LSYEGIATQLNAEGHTTRYGRPWTRAAVFKVEPLSRRHRVSVQHGRREHGAFGVEAQFLKNGEFSHSRRSPTRAQAIAWAHAEREAIVKGWREW
jgi:hypothetical protein